MGHCVDSSVKQLQDLVLARQFRDLYSTSRQLMLRSTTSPWKLSAVVGHCVALSDVLNSSFLFCIPADLLKVQSKELGVREVDLDLCS